MADQPPAKSIDVMERANQWKMKYYSTDLPNIRPEVREVFEQYSKIPANEVDAHITRIRDKAWNIHPYPCVGQWRFLDLAIGQHPSYPTVLRRMLTGEETFMDLGCAFAQDIRKLVCDGVPSDKCIGADLRLNFIDLGYDLFRDKETLKSRFIEADIFDPESGWKDVNGTVDIIGASSFFHLFDWEEQKRAAHAVVKLMRPRAGSLLVGRQVGCSTPGETARRMGKGSRYRHDLESWRRMWKEVGEEAGVGFQVSGQHGAVPESLRELVEAGDMVLIFEVRRL